MCMSDELHKEEEYICTTNPVVYSVVGGTFYRFSFDLCRCVKIRTFKGLPLNYYLETAPQPFIKLLT